MTNLARAEAGHLAELHRSYDRLLDDGKSDAERAAEYEHQREQAEQDMDAFSEFLAVECCRQTVKFGVIPRDEVRFADFLDSLTVAELVAYAVQYSGGDKYRAGMAMDKVAERYLKSRGL